jgi:hypothetical protein
MIIGFSDYSAVWLVTTGNSKYLMEGSMKGHVLLAVRLLVAWKPEPQPPRRQHQLERVPT